MPEPITITQITFNLDSTFVAVHLSNRSIIRMTPTCLQTLEWKIGTVIKS